MHCPPIRNNGVMQVTRWRLLACNIFLRQPLVQHPVIAHTQGVDKRVVSVQRSNTFPRLVYSAFIFRWNISSNTLITSITVSFLPSAEVTAPAAISAATSSIRSLSVPFQFSVMPAFLPFRSLSPVSILPFHRRA